MKLVGLGLAAVVCLCIGAAFSVLAAVLTAHDQANVAREAKERNDEITRLTKVNAELVTGGDSFCYLGFTQSKGDNAAISLVQSGKFAVTGISVRLLNLTNITEPPGGHIDEQLLERIPSIGVGAVVYIATIPLSSLGLAHFVEKINARNGAFSETIHGKRIDGNRRFTYEAYKYNPDGNRQLLIEADKNPK